MGRFSDWSFELYSRNSAGSGLIGRDGKMHGMLRPRGFPPLITQFSDLFLPDDRNFAENVLARCLMRRDM
jgi:hypothetical protein